jgi:electron transfer flavoprotein alpha subunit
MNIVVCVKQTPVAGDMRFDEDTKTLVREGVRLSISSLDRRAVLEALRFRDEVGGTVTVLTMGPPQADAILLEALALGADKGILLTDRVLAGSDTLATSRALAAAINKLEADLVVCGKFTIDSETGQVPSEIAELLGVPQVTSVSVLRETENPGVIWVERETDEGYEQYEVPMPAVISVTELVITSRRSSPEELETAGNKPIEEWSAADVNIDPATVGVTGSPTRVAELRPAHLERNGTVVNSDDSDDAAKKLAEYLVANGVFEPGRGVVDPSPRRSSSTGTDPAKAIWVVAEVLGDELRPVTFELLGKAQELADHTGGEVAALLVGGLGARKHIDALGSHGADTVYLALDDSLTTYETGRYTEILASAISEYPPYVVLIPSTTNGRDWAPRVAARLSLGLTGDCVDFEFDADGELAQIKPAFGGNIVSPIYSNTSPIMATARPGMLERRRPNSSTNPKTIDLPIPSGAPGAKFLGFRSIEPGLDPSKLDDARVVVTAGLGIGGAENLGVVRQLADALDGALAGSLLVTTNRWVPAQLQVGLTGKSVAPRFYIAVAVSGQPNHLFGSRKAEHIIAINNDPEAPIFKSADFGVVGDWAEIVPALTNELLAARHD